MHDKTIELLKGEIVNYYDKNLIKTSQEELDKILIAVQSESCFLVKIATDREINQAYTNFRKVMNISENDGNELSKWLNNKKIIWK